MIKNAQQHKRICRELFDLQNNSYYSAWPADESNYFNLIASIIGPSNSPFQEGIFFLNVNLHNDHPFKPPSVRFITKIYHPCVNSYGWICNDEIYGEWSPAISLNKILLSIKNSLADFNRYQIMTPEIFQVYENDKHQYEETAREWTQRYAT